jgi:septal ring factor EnvC (AmiA/AmiB activator)
MGAHCSREDKYTSVLVELESTKRKCADASKQLKEVLDDLQKARERIRSLEIILYDTPRD